MTLANALNINSSNPLPASLGGTGSSTSGSVSRYVVSTIASEGGFTSIQSAINQAVADGASALAPASVWIMPGTYTENITFAPYVSITSASPCNDISSPVLIVGAAVHNVGGSITISNVGFESNSASPALSLQSSTACDILVESVYIHASTSSVGLNCENAGSRIVCKFLTIVSDAIAQCMTLSDADIQFYYCNTYFTDTESTIATITVLFAFCRFNDAFTTGSSITTFQDCLFSSGNLPCINSNTDLFNITNCTFDSTNGSGFFIEGNNTTVVYANLTATNTANQIDTGITVTLGPIPSILGNISFDGGVTTLDTDGQIWIGSSTDSPAPATLTPGNYVTVTNAANQITLDAQTVDLTGFTVDLRFGGASTGITYTTQSLDLSRIGNLVFFCVQIVLTNKGSATGAATIGPLPNTSKTGLLQEFSVLTTNVTFTNTPLAVISSAANTISLVQNLTGSAYSALTDTHFSNNSQIYISGVYLV